jgi:hypothetical protein
MGCTWSAVPGERALLLDLLGDSPALLRDLRNVFYPAAGSRPRFFGVNGEVETPRQATEAARHRYAAALACSSPAVKDTARRFSYHEAGHALSCHMEGQGISFVRLDYTVVDNGALDVTGGYAQTPGDFSAVALGAGIGAERTAGYPPLEADRHARMDIEKFEKLKAEDGTEFASFADAVMAAELRCRANWPAVAALAERLYETGFVSGSDATAILRGDVSREAAA